MKLSSINPATGNLCVYNQIASGIYHFMFTSSSRAAADEYIDHMTALYQDRGYEPMLRFMIDANLGRLPLNHLILRLKQLLENFPNRPPTRTAFLANSGMASLLAGMIRLLPMQNKDKVRFFDPGAQDQAIHWLLSDK